MNPQLRDHSSVSLNSCVSQTSYWLPDVMAASGWIEHAPFGFWITGALRPRSVVELGVHHGFSYFVLCQAVQRLRLDARCFAIDSWVGDEHAGFYGDDVYDAVCSYNRRYDSFSRLIRSDFSDACVQFANGSIDLLHIDGCHTYEAARNDFESWLPKLSKRGVMLFHDTAEYDNGFGVHRLWEKLRRRYPYFEFMHGHGLGIIGVGDDVPAEVHQLFQASASVGSAQLIRTAYERLGAFVANAQRLAEQSAEIGKLTQQARQLEAEKAGYEASTSWRLTAPLRATARLMKSANGAVGSLRNTLSDVASTRGKAPDPVYRSQR